jgi:hypothetical protein
MARPLLPLAARRGKNEASAMMAALHRAAKGNAVHLRPFPVGDLRLYALILIFTARG